MARLDQAIGAILDALVAAIEGDVGAGKPLEGVKTVVRGDRARPMPQLPAVFVVPEAAVNDPPDYGSPEQWEMPVRIAGLVKSTDPETGGRECGRITALARAAAIRDPKLGLAYVIDTQSRRFDGTARPNPSSRVDEGNRNLFWADATAIVTFTVEE